MTDEKHALLTQLIDEYGSALEGYLCRRTGNLADACELAQETYLRMWQVKDIKEIREPKSYMFTIAAHLADERLRSRSRLQGNLDASDPLLERELSHQPDFVGEIDAEEELVKLRQAFAELPPNVRAAYLLQAGHGLSYEEIARHLNVTVHAVKKYLQQAVRHCRSRMDPKDKE